MLICYVFFMFRWVCCCVYCLICVCRVVVSSRRTRLRFVVVVIFGCVIDWCDFLYCECMVLVIVVIFLSCIVWCVCVCIVVCVCVCIVLMFENYFGMCVNVFFWLFGMMVLMVNCVWLNVGVLFCESVFKVDIVCVWWWWCWNVWFVDVVVLV